MKLRRNEYSPIHRSLSCCGGGPQTATRKYHNQTIHGPFREAQRFLNLRLQQRDNGRVSRAAVLSLNQLLDQWLSTVVKARVRARTFRDYEALLRLNIRPVLGSRLIGTITQIDMQSLYAQMLERGLSARTIEYTNAVVRSAFRQAVRWKMLAEDPCIGVDLPRVRRKEMEALSVEECRRFLGVAEKSEWYSLLSLALTTGMRPSEYLALKWSDIDWHRGTTSVCRTIQIAGAEWTFDDTKRKRSRRVVKLQNFVLKALQELREKQEGEKEGSWSSERELIFVSAAGLPLKQRTVKREFRKSWVSLESGRCGFTTSVTLRLL
jgi:integrase